MEDVEIGKIILNTELPDCEVGVPKDLGPVRVIATRNDSSGFEAVVYEVKGYATEESSDGKPEPEPEPKRKSNKEMAPAMEDY